MRGLRHILVAALFGLVTSGFAEAGCAGSDQPCRIDGGTYHIVLPDRPRNGHPALILLHGWAATAADMMKMKALMGTALDRGYALIMPDGLPRPDGPGQDWGFYPTSPGPRDETAFLKAAADDAAARFGLSRDRMLLAGFSIGGSMVSYVACGDPGAFAAYAPIAGNFWRPHPAACKGPVRLFHTHGWADRTVPLEGRHLDEGFSQGDVFAALQIWRETMGCTRMMPDKTGERGRFWLRSWTSCAAGGELLFALHPGGHGVPDGWVDLALDWFERGGEVVAAKP